MVPPKYEYYLGVNAPDFYPSRGHYNEAGLFMYEPYDKKAYKGLYGYTYGKYRIPQNENFIYALDLPNSSYTCYGYIYFYDKNESLIGSRWCINKTGGEDFGYYPVLELDNIIAPEGAEYIAFEFFPSSFFIELQKMKPLFLYTLHLAEPYFKELSKKIAKENGQMFFRETLEGKVRFIGRDFDTINNSSVNSTCLFIIKKHKKEGALYTYFKSSFTKLDCKLDLVKKQCEPKLTSHDPYENILAKYEDTYDLIKLAPAISAINYKSRRAIQVYIPGANTVSTYFSGTYQDLEVSEALWDHTAIRNAHFGWVDNFIEIDIEDCTGNPNVNGVYTAKTNRLELQQGVTLTLYQANGYYIILRAYASNKMAMEFYNASGLKLADTGQGTEYNYFSVSDTYVYVDSSRIVSEDGEKVIYVGDVYGGQSSIGKFTVSKVFTYQPFMRILCDLDKIKGSDGVVYPTHNIPYNDFTGGTYAYKKCIAFLSSGNMYISNNNTTKETKYGKNDYGLYFDEPLLQAIQRGYQLLRPVCRNSWVNASLWYQDNLIEDAIEPKYRADLTLKDSFSVGSAIRALLKEIDPTILHAETTEYSQFLYGPVNPVYGTTKFYVHITQKTNILKGEYDQAAQRAEITLESLMKMLKNCFNCYWYIEDNKFKIEHISFFKNGGTYGEAGNQLDLTKVKDQFNKTSEAAYMGDISYEKEGLFRKYEFNWADTSTDLFGNLVITNEAPYIKDSKSNDITVSGFSSEIDLMRVVPENFSNDGFALLCPVKENEQLVLPIREALFQDENKKEYKAEVQNYFASWPFLINFYLGDMPSMQVSINTIPDIKTAKLSRFKIQEVDIFSEEDPDMLKSIITSEGPGQIDEAVINLLTRRVKIKLKQKP